MSVWVTYTATAALVVLVSTALFFFTLTRGALILRGALGRLQHDAAHVYPIYSSRRLIRLVDWQPVAEVPFTGSSLRLTNAAPGGIPARFYRAQPK